MSSANNRNKNNKNNDNTTSSGTGKKIMFSLVLTINYLVNWIVFKIV